MAEKALRVAVIGAGISGLTCAYELQKGGAEVVVYEKDDHVGGRMVTRVKDDFFWDIGVDHLCNHYEHMRALCAELGVEWEKMRHVEYGIIRDKQVVPVSQVIGWWSKLRLVFQYYLIPKGTEFLDLNTAAGYDSQNAYDFMVDKCGVEVADYLVDAFCSSYEFHRAKEISIGALYAIMYSLKTKNEDWYLQRTKGGMSALPEALAKHLNVRLSTEVRQVQMGKKTNKIIVQTHGKQEEFDRVVLACTANVTKQILPVKSVSQRLLLEGVRYSSSISVAFRVDEKRFPSTTIFWVPFVESQAISSYANETMKGEQLLHDGKSLVSVWLHEGFAMELMNKSDEEIYVAVAEEFLKVCPWIESKEQLIAHDLQRWPQAEPKFYQGYLSLVKEFLDQEQGKDGVYLCGDYLNAPWAEGALRRGQQVAEQILAV